MDNITEKQGKSIIGKISLIAGLSNILLIVLVVLVVLSKNFVQLSEHSVEVIVVIIFSAFGLFLTIGIGTGIAAFIDKRAWVALVLNILILVFSVVIMFYVYSLFCCAPLPQIR